MIQPHQLALLRNRVSRPAWVRVGYTFPVPEKIVTISTGYTRNPFHPGQERVWQSVFANNDFRRGGGLLSGMSKIGHAWFDEQVKLFSNNHVPGSVVTSNLRDEPDLCDRVMERLSELVFASQNPWQGWERDHRSRRP